MADIIVDHVPIEATIEADVATAAMETELDTDSNIDLALEVTTWGGGKANFDNYLAKDNEEPYIPTGDYNPATKLYVDENSMIPRTGEELSTMAVEENLTGVVFCTEGYGDDYLEGAVYEYENGVLVKIIELSGVGGNTNQSETITPLEIDVAVGKPVILEYEFKSKSSGKGTAKLFINGVLKSSKIVSKEVNSFDITEFVKEGINYFTITITDSSSASVSFDYIVNGVKLTLKSSFNESTVYTGDITFTYTAIGAGIKTVTFTLDNEEIGSTEIKSSGEQSKYVLTGLTHGGHILKVLATTIVNDVLIESNELVYQILYAEEGVMTPIVSSSFSKTKAIEGELLSIDYIIYDPATTTANAYLQVNDETPLEISVGRTKQYWTISNYPVGEVVFKIGCGDVSISLPVTVEELNLDIEPVKDDLSLYLTAANRSNAEKPGTRELWSYNDITAKLTNVNWVGNGWINNTLKLTGEATGYIPYNIFSTDPKSAGRTIEIEFATHNIKNYESILLSCFTESKGIQITPTEAFLKSEQEVVKVRFKEDEKVRVSFVIESTNDNRLIRTYVNGILSGIAQYDSSDNFQQGSPVGITLNEGKEEIDIHTIRVYDIALSSRQILNNYICDLIDISEKIAKYQANNVYDLYGSISMAKIKSMIPILTITGELPPVKGEKKTVSTTYTDPFNPAMNFTKNNCIIDIQGTSSQYYPKKNYKIKFPEAFSFYDGAIPEREYTFKADYMESSHSHNTGNAILVNDLYSEFFPTQTAENGVRNAIYGFPCAIYYRANEAAEYEYFGAYNFNNDKGNAATLGLVGEKAQSWEFKNNTSAHCLLRSDDFSPEAKPEDDFEARYPDKYTDYTDLQRVVSWIVSTDGNLEKFKSEFNQHFNLHYCLIYYIMMDWALMMDSRAKNMFFDTIDGNIWYPRMYDMDTCYGLNNEGVLNFGYGLEQHDENIYNGENSLFWNNFEECYAKEIKDMYLSLRSSGKLSYDNMMMIFKQNQIEKICEAQFNEDAQFKYLNPVIEDEDTTYLYVAQGSRISHFQWWVSNRIKYLDSKYEAADYISDYITMRMYTDTGSITLTPYIDQYLKIKYGSSDVKVRGVAGEATLVPCPAGLTFNDTETIIYGANGISDLGDLSTKYPGTVDVSKGVKLANLKIGNSADGYQNPNLTTLTLGNNKLLRTIDVSNCPNLVGNLDVSKCTALREFYAAGSGLKGVTFVDGGDLEVLELPRGLTNLTIKNHVNLTTLNTTQFDNLQTLILKNSKLNASELLMANFKTLTRIYCIFEKEANIEMYNFVLNYLLKYCNGVDDNDVNTEYPNIQGYITILYPSTMTSTAIEEMKTTYANAFPYLNITYKSTPMYFTYNSGNNRVEFPVLNQNLPSTTIIPNREDIEDALGLAKGTINENTSFYMSNTANSSYKNTLNTLILPEGYSSYYLYGTYFTNLKEVVWPKGPAKITYYYINYNSDYTRVKHDFSANNLDLTDLTRLGGRTYNYDLEKVSLAGKTLNQKVYGYYSTSSSYQFYYLFYPYNGGRIDEIDFSNLTINTNVDYFGYIGIVSSGYYYMKSNNSKFNGRNMKLNNMKYANFYELDNYGEFDISGTSAPKATSLSFWGWTTNYSGENSNYNTNSPYYKNSSNRLKTIKLKGLDMPSLTSISFPYLYNIEMDLTTTNITSFKDCFRWCASLTPETIPLSLFKTNSATTLAGMFSHCYGMDDYSGTSEWDVSNVTDMSAMFEYNTKLTSLDINHFAPLELKNMSYMFYKDTVLEQIDALNIDTSHVTDYSSMFYGDVVLKNINLNIDFSSATTTSYMFYGCTSLESLPFNENGDNSSTLTDVSYMFGDCSTWTSLGGVENWNLSSVTTFKGFISGCKGLQNIVLNTNAQPIYIDYMFNNANLRTIEIPNLNTSKTTTFAYSFANNPNLERLTIGDNFSTESAINLSYMFYNTSLANFDLNRINTTKVTNMEGMFYNCKLTLEDIEKIKSWDTAKVTNMTNLFRGSIEDEAFDLNGLDISAVTSASDMFSDNPNLKIINIENVDFTNLSLSTVLTILLPNSIEKVDLSSVDKTATLDYNNTNVYPNKKNLKELIIPNINFTLHYQGSFFKDSPLEKVSLGDVVSSYSYYQTNNSYYYQYHNLFSGKTKLREVSVKSLLFYSAYNRVNLASFFNGCTSLETFDFGITDSSLNPSLNSMFKNCKAIKTIDLSWMATNSVTDMQYMFSGCSSLTSYNINGFNWSNVTNITHMFSNCTSLTKVTLKIQNAPKLTTANDLFNGCTSLTEVDLTGSDLDLITGMSNWFYKCTSLVEIDLSYLNVPKVTTYSGLFRECSNLKKANLRCLVSSANINASYMFDNCKNLEELDIRNWQINKIATASNYTSIFTNVPYTCKIIVKDEACRTWVKARNSAFSNVVLASEL